MHGRETFGWMNCTDFGFRSKVMMEDGPSQQSSSWRAGPFAGAACVAQIARSFQSIPIKMKSPTSVRKVTLMIATVRNTSLAGRESMNASHLAKPCSKSFRLENVSVPNADGARCERRRHPRRPALLIAGRKELSAKMRLVTSSPLTILPRMSGLTSIGNREPKGRGSPEPRCYLTLSVPLTERMAS
jgi:hypothetical protein